MKSTEQKVIRFIEENSLIQKGDKILLALSGGPDSVFLFYFLNKYKKKYQIDLAAFHLNHSLRKEADKEQKFCEKLCAAFDIQFFSEKVNVKSFAENNKLSVEEAGRKIRYKLLNKYCAENKFNKIATAHNANDNAETVILNLSKGTGLRGIAGITVKRDNIIRPILCLSKSEILDYLETARIKYVLDKSNLSTDYERNFVRLKIIPLIEKKLNTGFINSVLNTSLNLQNHYYLIDRLVNDSIEKYCDLFDEEIRINKNIFSGLDSFIISELIRKILYDKFNYSSEQVDVKKIFSLIKKQVGARDKLRNKILILNDRNHIIIYKSQHKKTSSVEIKLGEKKKMNSHYISITVVNKNQVKLTADKNVEYIDGELTGDSFLIRKWRQGDRFQPIGMKGTKKISDFLNDIKIDAKEKKNQYVLTAKNKIVWVIGKRLDERFKITPNTKSTYKIELLNE